MIASLMMYARPELEGAHTRLWTRLRDSLAARGMDAHETLSQTADEFTVWEDPALVFSQTCGMPYRTRLHHTVQLVGTPDYGLEGCAPGYYTSSIVVRADDPRLTLTQFAPARAAYNAAYSQSGFAALYARTQASGFWFANRVQSGSHLRSAQLVAEGAADIAALDSQTWRGVQRYEPWADQLRVLEVTPPTPALPYITGPYHDPDLVFAALTEALENLPPADARALDLRGIVRIPHETYMAVPNPPANAIS